MKISVVGTGYVGLVSGVCLAEVGHSIICVDVDEQKIEKINNGIPPIHEKGLAELLEKHIHNSLVATTDLSRAVMDTEVSMIAVGTPFDGEEIDLQYVKAVAYDIGYALKKKSDYHVVIVKSTVVPGTTDTLVIPVLEEASRKKAGKDFGVGMNPEFLREGEAVGDFMNPDRIVLGGVDPQTHGVMEALYAPFQGVDVIKTNNKTAEMIKYAANSVLATMISFSNEIGNLCTTLGGVDVVEVMNGVHKDKRLSPIMEDGSRVRPGFISYLEAGCGFGGSCFPKDVKALISHGNRAGYQMRILDSVIDVNKKQPGQVLNLLSKHFSSLKDIRVAILGLAFKPGTDDMRESPSIPIVQTLLQHGAQLHAYDPAAQNEAKKIFGDDSMVYHQELDTTLHDIDVIILLTRWGEFTGVPDLIKRKDPQPLFIDGRRMFKKEDFKRYEGIGLREVS
jgi:UDPglucose 6-dehydrogenase